MLIPEFYPSQLAIQSHGGPAGVRAWTVGQVLEATVVRQALDGTVTLRIGSHEVQARTGMALATDQPLTLQVAQSGTQVVLRILHVSHNAALADSARARAAVSPEQAVLAQAWRQVLPRAGELQPLLAEIARLVERPAPASGTAPPLPPALMQVLQRLHAALPQVATLTTPTGLRQALADSGVFLEPKLAQSLSADTRPALTTDLKANLVQLSGRLRALAGLAPDGAGRSPSPVASATELPAVAPLLRHAEAALARIEHNQLAMVGGQQPAPALIVADLPVREPNWQGVVQLRIEQDTAGRTADPSGVRPWSVWLRFDFETLGPVQARVSLAGDSVSVGLWAERATTAALFNTHLAELGGALRHAGLVAGELHCETGLPAAPPPPAVDRLLDERA
jgi:hypothetical protein